MKVKQLKKQLSKLGWYFSRQGKHEIWTNGTMTQPIPRHREIDEYTAKGILKIAKKYPGKKE